MCAVECLWCKSNSISSCKAKTKRQCFVLIDVYKIIVNMLCSARGVVATAAARLRDSAMC